MLLMVNMKKYLLCENQVDIQTPEVLLFVWENISHCYIVLAVWLRPLPSLPLGWEMRYWFLEDHAVIERTHQNRSFKSVCGVLEPDVHVVLPVYWLLPQCSGCICVGSIHDRSHSSFDQMCKKLLFLFMSLSSNFLEAFLEHFTLFCICSANISSTTESEKIQELVLKKLNH